MSFPMTREEEEEGVDVSKALSARLAAQREVGERLDDLLAFGGSVRQFLDLPPLALTELLLQGVDVVRGVLELAPVTRLERLVDVDADQ
jgi:hypothetical protein